MNSGITTIIHKTDDINLTSYYGVNMQFCIHHLKHCISLTTHDKESKSKLGFLPLQSSSVDLFPPTFSRLSKRIWGGHAGIIPQSVRSFLLAEHAPHCYNNLPMRALEVETLPVHISPVIISPIVIIGTVKVPILAPCHCE